MTRKTFNVFFTCTGNSACSILAEALARPEASQMDFVFTVCDQAAGEVCPSDLDNQ